MRQKQADLSLFTALINELPTHESLSCNRYLYHNASTLNRPLKVTAYCLAPLSLDGSCILSASAGLEPEDHSRQTSVFCPDSAGEVSGSLGCSEERKIVFNLEAADVIVMAGM